MQKLKQENLLIPTKTEMDVLRLLWQHGPSTVRFVHDKLNENKEAVIYTSTLKLMQLMKDKGLLSRNENQMKHIYTASLQEGKVKGNMLSRFVDSMFEGSPSNLMVALLGDDRTSSQELQKIKILLTQIDQEKS